MCAETGAICRQNKLRIQIFREKSWRDETIARHIRTNYKTRASSTTRATRGAEVTRRHRELATTACLLSEFKTAPKSCTRQVRDDRHIKSTSRTSKSRRYLTGVTCRWFSEMGFGRGNRRVGVCDATHAPSQTVERGLAPSECLRSSVPPPPQEALRSPTNLIYTQILLWFKSHIFVVNRFFCSK